MDQTQENGLTWVRLHLVPQNDNHAMPPFVTGILSQETQGAYVLLKVLEQDENEGGIVVSNSPNMHFINRTYVWCCEVLKDPPQLENFGMPYNEPGGLG